MHDLLSECIVEAWWERTWKRVKEVSTLLTVSFLGFGGGFLLAYVIWGPR